MMKTSNVVKILTNKAIFNERLELEGKDNSFSKAMQYFKSVHGRGKTEYHEIGVDEVPHEVFKVDKPEANALVYGRKNPRGEYDMIRVIEFYDDIAFVDPVKNPLGTYRIMSVYSIEKRIQIKF